MLNIGLFGFFRVGDLNEVGVDHFLNSLLVNGGIWILNEPFVNPLVVCDDHLLYDMFLHSPTILTSFECYLHSEFHKFVPKRYSIQHLVHCDSLRYEPLFFQELYRVSMAIECVEVLDQELYHNLHLEFVFDYQVKVFVLKLDS